MTTKQIREALDGVVDTLGKNKAGNYVARRGFFYTNGGTADKFAEEIKRQIPAANILNTWERWTAFRGGASTANQSHWGVEFEVSEILVERFDSTNKAVS